MGHVQMHSEHMLAGHVCSTSDLWKNSFKGKTCCVKIVFKLKTPMSLWILWSLIREEKTFGEGKKGRTNFYGSLLDYAHIFLKREMV